MKILQNLIVAAVFTLPLIFGCRLPPPVNAPFAAREHMPPAEMPEAASHTEVVGQNKSAMEALAAENSATPPLATSETFVTSSERMVKPRQSYTVGEGELLWSIAKRPDIYGDPLLWPLLYQANRDQIKDPRKIYTGQTLTIPRNISEEEREEARNRAKQSNFFSHE